MSKIQNYLMLSDRGYSDLKAGIFACTLTNLSLMQPFGSVVLLLWELFKPLLGEETSTAMLWLYFALALLGAFVSYLASRNDYDKTYVSAYNESENARLDVAEHIRKLPMSVFNSKNLSELTTNLMNDAAVAEQTLSHIVPQIVASTLSIGLMSIMLSFLSWQLALSMFFSVPLSLGVIYFAKIVGDYYGKKFSKRKFEASNQVQEYFDGMKVIKACNLDGEKAKHLQKALEEMKKISIKYEFITGIFVTGAQVLLQVGIGVTVLVGVKLILGNEISFLTLIVFLLLVTRVYGPILTVLVLLPEMLHHAMGIERTRTLMAIDIMEGKDDIVFPSFDIAFEDVSFSYHDKETLKHVSTTMEQGCITALVGPSGSGKSTMTKLVARFWDTAAGNITIGGVNIKGVDPEYLLSYMSFVFQDVILFQDSIYNNILIGNKNATREQVLAAAKAAQCDGFISALKEGYDTMVGENGATLSGGERQRISIARALLKDAPIVLLDEATASIDPANEAHVQKAINRLIAGRTVVVIAHKLKTIQRVDKIVVLENGAINQEGTHDELLAEGGLYARLWDIQNRTTAWSL